MDPNEQIPDDRNKSAELPGIPGVYMLTEKAIFGVYRNGQFKTDLSMTEIFFNYSGDYLSAHLQNPVNDKHLIGVVADVKSQKW